MNRSRTSSLMNVLTYIPTPPEIPKACLCINGHVLIQQVGRRSRCLTSEDHAGIVMQASLWEDTVQVMYSVNTWEPNLSRYSQEKRTGRRPKRKIINKPHVPLPVVRNQIIILDRNTVHFERFLSETHFEKGSRLQRE